MMTRSRYFLLWAALAFSSCIFGLEEKPTANSKTETLRGQVVPLAELLKKDNVELDKDAEPFWLALKTDDGKIHPLVKDVGSRMFYQDKTLLRRPMQVQGRFVGNTGLLQLTQVLSIKDAKLHDIYYWCDVCAIKRTALDKSGVCECCGGKMELKEVPLEK
jgi:hypothetical protein